MESRYIHDTNVHNVLAPKEIVPILIELFSPKSVVDVGCGIGTFLHVFKENNVSDLVGLDGAWVDKKLLSQNIPLSCFLEVNLEEKVRLNRKFDMAICLEVAEHLHKDFANNIVLTLTNLSDVVVFSAAIPNQGGQNHLNEQWLSYWEKLFNACDFLMYDIIRPQIWDNPNIYFWYKQNMVVFIKKGNVYNALQKKSSIAIKNIVHPELYMRNINILEKYQKENKQLVTLLNQIYSGDYPIGKYLRMILNYIKFRIKKQKKSRKLTYSKRFMIHCCPLIIAIAF